MVGIIDPERWSSIANNSSSYSSNGWRNDNDMYWKTKDKRVLYIPDMEDSHILNAIKLCETRLGMERLLHVGTYRNMVTEAKKRNLYDRDWDL